MRKPQPYVVPIEKNELYLEVDRIYGDMLAGKCGDSLDRLKTIAQDGNDLACCYVGAVYQHGLCTAIDLSSAKKYFRKSALAGIGEAYYQLGRIYIDEKEYDLACAELRLASRLGVPVSDFWLYHALQLTRDFDPDEVRGAIIRSIDQGNVTAMADYGAFLLYGGLGKREILKGISYKIRAVINYIKLVRENKSIEDQLH